MQNRWRQLRGRDRNLDQLRRQRGIGNDDRHVHILVAEPTMLRDLIRGGVNRPSLADGDNIRRARIEQRIGKVQFQQVIRPDVLDGRIGLVVEQDTDCGSGVALVLEPKQLRIVAAGQQHVVGRFNQRGNSRGVDKVQLGRINRRLAMLGSDDDVS